MRQWLVENLSRRCYGDSAFDAGFEDGWQEAMAAVIEKFDETVTIDELVTAILALDGVQECDLAVALVRADARRADEFCVTLGEALKPAQSAVQSPSATVSIPGLFEAIFTSKVKIVIHP